MVTSSALPATAFNAGRAVQIGVISSEPATIEAMNYQLTVPALPALPAQGAYEFHAGVTSISSSILVKTTFSYGCEIAQHKACSPPFLNRYVFYLSIVNTATGNRNQAPENGWPLTVGSTYTVSLVSKPCPSSSNSAWDARISNATSSLSVSLCLLTQTTFNAALAGMLEIHNITQCSQLSSSRSFDQQDISVLSGSGQSLPLSWTKFGVPTVSCGIGIATSPNSPSVRTYWSTGG